jgi:hypothetical protein
LAGSSNYSKEMELFLPLPVIISRKFFYNRFLILSNNFKMVFSNRKWNYLNRKWIYFSPFQLSDQETSLTKVSPYGPMIPKWFSETGNGIIQTGNGIISLLSSHRIKKLLQQKYPHLVQRLRLVFRKWNYLNRKWNYFSPFQSSDQKTSLTKVSPFGPTIPKGFSETGNGMI